MGKRGVRFGGRENASLKTAENERTSAEVRENRQKRQKVRRKNPIAATKARANAAAGLNYVARSIVEIAAKRLKAKNLNRLGANLNGADAGVSARTALSSLNSNLNTNKNVGSGAEI